MVSRTLLCVALLGLFSASCVSARPGNTSARSSSWLLCRAAVSARWFCASMCLSVKLTARVIYALSVHGLEGVYCPAGVLDEGALRRSLKAGGGAAAAAAGGNGGAA